MIRTRLVELKVPTNPTAGEVLVGEITMPAVPPIPGVAHVGGRLCAFIGSRWECELGQEAYLVVALQWQSPIVQAKAPLILARH